MKFGPCQIISGFSFLWQISCPNPALIISKTQLFIVCIVKSRLLPVCFTGLCFSFSHVFPIKVSIPFLTTGNFSIMRGNHCYYTRSLPGGLYGCGICVLHNSLQPGPCNLTNRTGGLVKRRREEHTSKGRGALPSSPFTWGSWGGWVAVKLGLDSAGLSVPFGMSASAGIVWRDLGWEPAWGRLWTPGRLPGGLLEGHPPAQQQPPQPSPQPYSGHFDPAHEPDSGLSLTGKQAALPCGRLARICALIPGAMRVPTGQLYPECDKRWVLKYLQCQLSTYKKSRIWQNL